MPPRRFPGFVSVLVARRFPRWVPLLALAGALLALWALWPVTVLEIRAGPEERLVKAIRVTPRERITYRYLHSVQKTPVDEVIEVVSNGHLVVRETAYETFGAGLPSDLPDGTFVADAGTGRFRILDMSRDLPEWRVRVAFTAEQTLEVRGERFRLDSLAAPTTVLVIAAVHRPRFSVLPE